MVRYAQLNYQERHKIYRGILEGKSLRAIAKSVDRSPSTISREKRRNSDYIGYYAPFAQDSAIKRKAKHESKVKRIPAFDQYFIKRLKDGWSPIVIAGRWNKENSSAKITPETIYRYIYHPKNKAFALHKLLPRRKSKRGIMRRSRKPGRILNRTSIHERPDHINQRLEVGHFEGDLIFHNQSQKLNTFTAIDRKTRYAIMLKNRTKNSAVVIEKIGIKLGYWAKSITFDNGTEFAYHDRLRNNGIKTYFCDPGSPWQKGSIEHFNGMTRRLLPFKVLARDVTQEMLDKVANILNHRPRKSLDFLTPCEALKASFQREIIGCCTSSLT